MCPESQILNVAAVCLYVTNNWQTENYREGQSRQTNYIRQTDTYTHRHLKPKIQSLKLHNLKNNMNPKHLLFKIYLIRNYLFMISLCKASWCNDFDTHSRANSKESKLGPSFIIIKDPTRYMASCWVIIWRTI